MLQEWMRLITSDVPVIRYCCRMNKSKKERESTEKKDTVCRGCSAACRGSAPRWRDQDDGALATKGRRLVAPLGATEQGVRPRNDGERRPAGWRKEVSEREGCRGASCSRTGGVQGDVLCRAGGKRWSIRWPYGRHAESWVCCFVNRGRDQEINKWPQSRDCRWKCLMGVGKKRGEKIKGRRVKTFSVYHFSPLSTLFQPFPTYMLGPMWGVPWDHLK